MKRKISDLHDRLIDENWGSICESCNDVHFEGHASMTAMSCGCEGGRCESAKDDYIDDFACENNINLQVFPTLACKLGGNTSIDGINWKCVVDSVGLMKKWRVFVDAFDKKQLIADELADFAEEYNKEVKGEFISPDMDDLTDSQQDRQCGLCVFESHGHSPETLCEGRRCEESYELLIEELEEEYNEEIDTKGLGKWPELTKVKSDTHKLGKPVEIKGEWNEERKKIEKTDKKLKETNMHNSTENYIVKEGLKKCRVAVFAPGATRANTEVVVDTNDNKIWIQSTGKGVTSIVSDEVSAEKNVSLCIPKKFDVKELKYTVKAGIIEVTIPTSGRILVIESDK